MKIKNEKNFHFLGVIITEVQGIHLKKTALIQLIFVNTDISLQATWHSSICKLSTTHSKNTVIFLFKIR